MDSFLWRGRGIKHLIYEILIDIVEKLIARIATAATIVYETPYILERTRQSMIRRCQLCNEVNGRQFQQLL